MSKFTAIRNSIACPIISTIILCAPNPAHGQTLDQKAWNAVWDRLNTVLPQNTPSESVHALRVIVPATWADRSTAGLRELQNYAGAIPEEIFSIDPSRMRKQLHKIYSDFVLDVALPSQDPNQKAAFQAAEDAYTTAFNQYITVQEQYLAKWDKHIIDLQRRGEPIDTVARMDFRRQNSGVFRSVQAKLDAASNDAQKFAPVADQWAKAVRALRDEVTGATSDLRDLYGYDGGFATLKAIENDCPEAGPGWDELSFSSSINSQNLRTSAWNGGGGWAGTFFKLNVGGGGDNYNNVVTTSNENVKLKFCNLTYIPLRPGAWFDISMLQAIDAGNLTLKPGSPSAGKKILGSTGAIPRMVKGAVVARRVIFDAKLGTTALTEMRKNSGGSGGVSIGPWNIGGSAGTTLFTREFTTADGGYGRSTATTVPVIIAIITEPTK